jgi:hypothetical protein
LGPQIRKLPHLWQIQNPDHNQAVAAADSTTWFLPLLLVPDNDHAVAAAAPSQPKLFLYFMCMFSLYKPTVTKKFTIQKQYFPSFFI